MTIISFRAGDFEIPILCIGDGWLAADKPAGMSVHNDPGRDLCSVLGRFLDENPDVSEKTGRGSADRLHPVHRIDRETSGVVILAARPDVFKAIAEQFENRTVEKLYHAVLHGDFENEKKEGHWDWPLSKKPGGRNFPQGKGKRATCRTRFKVLDQSAHYALVACEPLTGRTHQVRRHAKLAGHPVVGDPRYGSPRSLKYLKENRGFHRMGLHAMRLRFTPPGRQERTTVGSAGFPCELTRLMREDK